MLEGRQFKIEKGDIAMVVGLSRLLPEFEDSYGPEEYERRLKNVKHLILVAYLEGQAVGFKVGYEKEQYLYSWMGGVLPSYRGLGIAKALAGRQEQWARKQGYDRIVFKTRNKHKAMLVFALKNSFDIIGFSEKENISENRILLRKSLRNEK